MTGYKLHVKLQLVVVNVTLIGTRNVKTVMVTDNVSATSLVMRFPRWNMVRVRKKNMTGTMVVSVDMLRSLSGSQSRR